MSRPADRHVVTGSHPFIGPHGAYAITAADRIRRVREISDLDQLAVAAETKRLQLAVLDELTRQRRRLIAAARLPLTAARSRVARESNPGVRAALAARLNDKE